MSEHKSVHEMVQKTPIKTMGALTLLYTIDNILPTVQCAENEFRDQEDFFGSGW